MATTIPDMLLEILNDVYRLMSTSSIKLHPAPSMEHRHATRPSESVDRMPDSAHGAAIPWTSVPLAHSRGSSPWSSTHEMSIPSDAKHYQEQATKVKISRHLA